MQIPIHLGSDRQLFLDDYWIEKSSAVTRVLHNPVRREAAIAMDRPWEDGALHYLVTFWDELFS